MRIKGNKMQPTNQKKNFQTKYLEQIWYVKLKKLVATMTSVKVMLIPAEMWG